MNALLRNALLSATFCAWFPTVAAAASPSDAAAAAGREATPGVTAPGSDRQDLGALVDRLVLEVMTLKLDLAAQQIENEEERIRSLEQEIERVHAARIELEDEERAQREMHEVSPLDSLTEGVTDEEQRAELQAIAAQIDSAERQESRERSKSLDERERQASSEIERRRKKLQELRARTRPTS